MRFIELKQLQKSTRSLTCFALEFERLVSTQAILFKRWKEFEPAIYRIHYDTS